MPIPLGRSGVLVGRRSWPWTSWCQLTPGPCARRRAPPGRTQRPQAVPAPLEAPALGGQWAPLTGCRLAR
eukprot:7460726-Lingulodinium_polyedra.AAC.1